MTLEDEKIIALYLERNEDAIHESHLKYGAYCKSISQRILGNKEDAEECVNDTYLDAWQAIPPAKPRSLSLFLGAITRRISIDRWRRQATEKRGKRSTPVPLTELEDCIPSDKSIDDMIETREIARILSRFLRTRPEIESAVFLRRYFHMESIGEIARRFDFSESKTKMMLQRIRNRLQEELEKEGIFL